MPWETRWVPAQSDPSLPVLDELPEGDWHREDLFGYPYAFGGGGRRFYRCSHCAGWIEGQPAASRVNTLGPLSGRQGTEYHCRRCGSELAFSGMMS
jgi:hypothetical protein